MNEPPTILFDGVCNFCNAAVNFVIRHDRKGVFRFAPLQSAAGQRLLEAHGLPALDPQSFVLIENGKTYQRTTASLRLARHLSPWWRWTEVFWIVPAPIRDLAYRLFARFRYTWFGKKEACMVPTRELRSRFLD